MAEIYLAQMAGSDGFSKLVVVKRLLADLAKDNEYVQMFLDEARINARLNHSNIVQVLELGEVDGQYFIAMEYVSGLSIAQVGKLATQRLGEVPQNIACGIMLQSCAGLHHAHETKLSDADEPARRLTAAPTSLRSASSCSSCVPRGACSSGRRRSKPMKRFRRARCRTRARCLRRSLGRLRM